MTEEHGDMSYGEIVRTVFDHLVEDVLVPRNKKYGKDNIEVFCEKGVVVRLGDKFNRLKKAVVEGNEEFDDEKILDTWQDVVGYGIIGILCHRGLYFDCGNDDA